MIFKKKKGGGNFDDIIFECSLNYMYISVVFTTISVGYIYDLLLFEAISF